MFQLSSPRPIGSRYRVNKISQASPFSASGTGEDHIKVSAIDERRLKSFCFPSGSTQPYKIIQYSTLHAIYTKGYTTSNQNIASLVLCSCTELNSNFAKSVWHRTYGEAIGWIRNNSSLDELSIDAECLKMWGGVVSVQPERREWLQNRCVVGLNLGLFHPCWVYWC